MRSWTWTVAALLCLVALVQAEPRPALKEGSKAEVRADFEMICNAVKRSGASDEKDPTQKATKIANYLLAHLKTTQALSALQSMAGMLPAEKPAALRRAAVAGGYTGPCPFADDK